MSDVLAAVLTREVDFGRAPAGDAPARRERPAPLPRARPAGTPLRIGEARHLLRAGRRRDELAIATPPRPRRLLRLALPWAVAAALAAALLFSVRPRPAADVVAAEPLPPAGTAFDLRVRGPGPVALSPDGSRIAFAAQARDAATLLYVRTIADGRVTEFPGSEGAQFPFWSPDGRWVAFFSRVDGKLKKVPVEGGSALTICRALNGKGGSWGKDDVIVLAPSSGSTLWSVSASGGEPTPLTRLGERHNSHRHPRFLPDGRHFLYLARSPHRRERGPPRIGRRRPAAARHEVGDPGRVRLRHLLFARESVLMAQPFDPGKGELTGRARPVVDGVLVLPGAPFSAFSASATGLLVFHSGEPQAPVPVELRDRKGLPCAPSASRGTTARRRSPPTAAGSRRGDAGRGRWQHRHLALRHDRRRRAPVHARADRGRRGNLVARRQDALLRLEPERPARHLPQERRRSRESGARPRDGRASEIDERLEGRQSPHLRLRGGRTDLLFALDLETGHVRPLREGAFNDAHGVLSPDGRWLAFDSDETGRPEVYVTPFPGPGRTWPLSTDGGRYPEWRGDGREIVYAALDGRFLAVPVPGGRHLPCRAGDRALPDAPPPRDYRDWGMSPDGQLFAIVPSGVSERRTSCGSS